MSSEEKSAPSDSESSPPADDKKPRKGNVKMFDENLTTIRPSPANLQVGIQGTERQPSGHPRLYDENYQTIRSPQQNYANSHTHGGQNQNKSEDSNPATCQTEHDNANSLDHASNLIQDFSERSGDNGSQTLYQTDQDKPENMSWGGLHEVHGASEPIEPDDLNPASADNSYTSMDSAQDEYESLNPSFQEQSGDSVGDESKMDTIYRRQNGSPQADVLSRPHPLPKTSHVYSTEAIEQDDLNTASADNPYTPMDSAQDEYESLNPSFQGQNGYNSVGDRRKMDTIDARQSVHQCTHGSSAKPKNVTSRRQRLTDTHSETNGPSDLTPASANNLNTSKDGAQDRSESINLHPQGQNNELSMGEETETESVLSQAAPSCQQSQVDSNAPSAGSSGRSNLTSDVMLACSFIASMAVAITLFIKK